MCLAYSPISPTLSHKLPSIMHLCIVFFRSGPSTDALTADTKLILEEVTRYLNLEKLLPCYRLTITVRSVLSFEFLYKYISGIWEYYYFHMLAQSYMPNIFTPPLYHNFFIILSPLFFATVSIPICFEPAFETWAMMAENPHSLERAGRMMVRWMCGVSLKDE